MALIKRHNGIECVLPIKRDGKTIHKYLGRGAKALAAQAEIDAQKRIREAEWASRRGRTSRYTNVWSKINIDVAAFSERVNIHFRNAMLASGYFENARTWHKRRRDPMTAVDQKGAKAGQKLFRPATPALLSSMGVGLSKKIRELLITKLSVDPAIQADIRKQAATLQKKLEGKNPTLIESLIIERVVMGWIHVAFAESLFIVCAADLTDLNLGAHADAMLARANKGYLHALRCLDRVRKCAPMLTHRDIGKIPPYQIPASLN